MYKEKGYFKDAGLDVDIKLPPEDSSSDLIINGKAPFGIYFKILWLRNWIKVRVLPLLSYRRTQYVRVISRKDAAIYKSKRFGW